MKALFRTKKGSLVIEELRNIPMPAQVWRVAVSPELIGQVVTDGEIPDVAVSVTELTYTRIGETTDGTPIYEHS